MNDKNNINMDNFPSFFDPVVDQVAEKVCKSLEPKFDQLLKALQDDEYIKGKEAQEILDVSGPTLQRWRDKGLIRFHRFGTSIRYKRSELLEDAQKVRKYGRAGI